MLYCSWDEVRDRCNYFLFWAIFCPFTPLTAQKIKIKKKMKKRPGDIIILLMCIKNYDQIMYSSWDMVRDGRTDGRKKWHIEWVPQLKTADIMNTVFKEAPPRQFSILINDSNLWENDFHQTLKRAAVLEQTLVVRGTSCLFCKKMFLPK